MTEFLATGNFALVVYRILNLISDRISCQKSDRSSKFFVAGEKKTRITEIPCLDERVGEAGGGVGHGEGGAAGSSLSLHNLGSSILSKKFISLQFTYVWKCRARQGQGIN